MAKFQQPRNIKAQFTNFVNKVFSLNTQWVNDGIEVIEASGDNSPKAYEQYPWDNENYPIVVLFSEGSTDDHWGINSLISRERETLKLGDTPRAYETLTGDAISTAITPKLSDFTIHSADLLIKNIGPYQGPIYLDIHSDNSGSPGTVLASGSIRGTQTVGIEWLHALIRPKITLTKDSMYHLTARAPSGSYYWFVDDDITAGLTPFPYKGVYDGASWTMTSDSAAIAKIYSPSIRRLGGGLNSTIRLFTEAKDLSTAQKISDLLFVYLHLAKHSNIGRREKLIYPSAMSMDFDFVSELTDEGIYIIDVNKGTETVRNRGNDRLFSIDISVSCYSSWTEDFTLPTLDSVSLTDLTSVQKTLNKYT